MGSQVKQTMLRFGKALRGPLSRRADSVLLGFRSLPQTPQLHASCLPRRLMSTSPPEPSSDDSIELFRIENRHPMITYMPYIAVFQLGCWGVYAQTAIEMGEETLMMIGGLGLALPAAVVYFRKCYVTNLSLSSDLETVIITTEALPPFSQTRKLPIRDLRLGGGQDDAKTSKDGADNKLSFQAEGEKTFYVLDRNQAEAGGADTQALLFVLSGKATPRAIKPVVKKVLKNRKALGAADVPEQQMYPR